MLCMIAIVLNVEIKEYLFYIFYITFCMRNYLHTVIVSDRDHLFNFHLVKFHMYKQRRLYPSHPTLTPESQKVVVELHSLNCV